MRFVRAFLTASLVAIVALGGSSASAFAASDNAAAPWRYDFGWEYCWDGGSTDYCFDMKGNLHVTEFTDGSSFATINARQTTKVYENGILVATVVENTLDRSMFDGFGEVSMLSVAHTRVTGADQQCVFTTILKKVDFEIVLDHWSGPGCR